MTDKPYTHTIQILFSEFLIFFLNQWNMNKKLIYVHTDDDWMNEWMNECIMWDDTQYYKFRNTIHHWSFGNNWFCWKFASWNAPGSSKSAQNGFPEKFACKHPTLDSFPGQMMFIFTFLSNWNKFPARGQRKNKINKWSLITRCWISQKILWLLLIFVCIYENTKWWLSIIFIVTDGTL